MHTVVRDEAMKGIMGEGGLLCLVLGQLGRTRPISFLSLTFIHFPFSFSEKYREGFYTHFF